MNKTTKSIKTWVLAASLGLISAASVQAQTSSITRVSSFEYDTSGRLVKEVIEPDSPQNCLQTAHGYNAQGNSTSESSSPCAGASGHTLDSAGTRSTTKEYLAQSVVINGVGYAFPAGSFVTRITNALNQSESYEYDPRHGEVSKLTGPNGGVTTWAYDGFGRKTRENRADGTYTAWEYKLCQLPGQPLDPICATPVSNGEFTHAHEWYVKEVSYGVNNVAMAAATYQIHDALGRVVRVRSDSFMAEGFPANRFGSIQDTVYNGLGQKVSQSIAYLLQGGSPQWTTFAYDDLGRVTHEISPDGNGGTAVLETKYDGLRTEITNARLQIKKIYKNAQGQTERIEDEQGGQILYTYDALGQLIETSAAGSITKLSYDVRGRKTGMQDPAMGRWNYEYNAFDELIWQQDSLSQVVTMQYDPLGRMTSRTEPDLVSHWHYDQRANGSSCGAGIGKLCEATANNGYRRLHTYDTLGRPISTSNVLDSVTQPALASQVYDSNTGRLIEQTWPTGSKVIYQYTEAGVNWSAGHLWRVLGEDGGTQMQLWQAMDKDPQGRLIRYLDGNGVVTLKDIEQATGKTRSLKSTLNGQTEGNVLNQSFTYDKLGNLTNRSDANTGVTEVFSYDSLNRLSLTSTLGGGLATQQQVQVLYDARGNIKYKSDVGYYHYDAQRPNRLTAITLAEESWDGAIGAVTVANSGTKALAYAFDDYLPGVRSVDLGQGNVALGNGNLMYTVSDGRDHGGAHTVRWEEYTSFNKISQMRFGSLSNPSDPTNAVADRTVDLVYGPEHQRLRQTVQLTSNAPSHMEAGTTWYMNGPDSLGLSYEKEIKANGLIEHKHYLSAGGEVFAQFTKREGNLNGKPAQQVSYFHHDHLGSLAVITNEVGQVTERLAYDPWGKRRFADGNKDNSDTLTSANTKRGFTMHEHMDEMGVINMNGRVYDPAIGRFLTADPHIQSASDLQSFNRYSYVLNNPLTYTDPTGYFSFKKFFRAAVAIVVAVVIAVYVMPAILTALPSASAALGTLGAKIVTGAVAGGVSSAIQAGSGKAFWRGALAGAIFAGAGQVGATNTSLARYAAHAGAGCVTAVAGGGKCGQGAVSGLLGKFASNVGGPLVAESTPGEIASKAIAGSLAAGVGASLSGGKFSDGAMLGAIGYAANGIGDWIERKLDGQDVHRSWTGMVRQQGPNWGSDDTNKGGFDGRPDAYERGYREIWELKSSGCLASPTCSARATTQLNRYIKSGTESSNGNQWRPGSKTPIANIMMVQGSRGTYFLTYKGNGMVAYDIVRYRPAPIVIPMPFLVPMPGAGPAVRSRY